VREDNRMKEPGPCGGSGPSRTRGCGWPTVVSLTVLMMLTTSMADAKRANPTAAQAAQAAEARKACLLGDYQKGTAILAELFVKTREPNWLYNQGRCLEQNARYQEAILRFEEYLRVSKDGSAAGRSEAEEHIADCQAKLAKSSSIAPPPAFPLAEQQQALTPPPASTVEQATPAPAPRGRGLRVAGIAAGAVGAASLVTAMVLNVKANTMADDLNQPAGYDRDKVSQRSNYETMSWVGYGVGSACLVGGAVLYYLGRRSGSAPAVALFPTVASGQAGVNLHGAF
jgi:hypothetical protein